MTLWLNGTSKQSLSKINNDTRTLTEVRLGAQGIETGTRGALYFDDFDSRRFSAIGTLPDPGADVQTAPAPQGWVGRAYAYDPNHPHAAVSLTLDDGSNTNVGQYTYDANGNMTCRFENGDWFIQSYNAENRLSAVTKLASGDCSTPGTYQAVWNFSYDGDGTRVAQLFTPYIDGQPQTDVLTVYFLGGAYEVTTDANGATLSAKKYYSIAGMTVALNDGTGLQYLLTDQLGSVVAVTDSSGTLTSQQRYLPFGQLRTDLNGPRITQTDFAYTGQRALDDGMGGLMDYKARAYDPLLMRWVQPDSVISNASNPQSFNRYSYVNNSPIVYNDPSGHQDECAILGACPDYAGVEKAISLMVQVDRGGKDILVAAGIAVQSEWPDVNNPLTPNNSGLGPAQLSRAQLDTPYGKPVPGSEQYGLGLKGEDPANPSTAVTGMSRRIYQVINACSFCSAEDKLIMAALAQNGGFTLASIKDIKGFYYNKTTGINWAKYFTDRTQSSIPYKWRAEAAGGYIYDTNFMLLLYTNDLLELNRRGWDLPFGLTRSDIYRMRNKYLHLPIPNFDTVTQPV